MTIIEISDRPVFLQECDGCHKKFKLDELIYDNIVLQDKLLYNKCYHKNDKTNNKNKIIKMPKLKKAKIITRQKEIVSRNSIRKLYKEYPKT